MSTTTIDCGEGKHDLCIGWGTDSYLIPQRAGERFDCGCSCHEPVDDFDAAARDWQARYFKEF
jgi:hypothetical protein